MAQMMTRKYDKTKRTEDYSPVSLWQSMQSTERSPPYETN